MTQFDLFHFVDGTRVTSAGSRFYSKEGCVKTGIILKPFFVNISYNFHKINPIQILMCVYILYPYQLWRSAIHQSLNLKLTHRLSHFAVSHPSEIQRSPRFKYFHLLYLVRTELLKWPGISYKHNALIPDH